MHRHGSDVGQCCIAQQVNYLLTCSLRMSRCTCSLERGQAGSMLPPTPQQVQTYYCHAHSAHHTTPTHNGIRHTAKKQHTRSHLWQHSRHPCKGHVQCCLAPPPPQHQTCNRLRPSWNGMHTLHTLTHTCVYASQLGRKRAAAAAPHTSFTKGCQHWSGDLLRKNRKVRYPAVPCHTLPAGRGSRSKSSRVSTVAAPMPNAVRSA